MEEMVVALSDAVKQQFDALIIYNDRWRETTTRHRCRPHDILCVEGWWSVCCHMPNGGMKAFSVDWIERIELTRSSVSACSTIQR